MLPRWSEISVHDPLLFQTDPQGSDRPFAVRLIHTLRYCDVLAPTLVPLKLPPCQKQIAGLVHVVEAWAETALPSGRRKPAAIAAVIKAIQRRRIPLIQCPFLS